MDDPSDDSYSNYIKLLFILQNKSSIIYYGNVMLLITLKILEFFTDVTDVIIIWQCNVVIWKKRYSK